MPLTSFLRRAARALLPRRRDAEQRLALMESQVAYLEMELSRVWELVRHLAAPAMAELAVARQTRESFDFQWDLLPPGRYNLANADFRAEAADYVCQFTGLPPSWFKGKSVVDVGCGAGRYSWAMASMGARVLSLDQSPHGLERARAACRDFEGHRTMRVNLLEPLDLNERFDLVWSFGVLHHTGDTFGAFGRIHPLVAPGGYLFLMLYGEPRKGVAGDYAAVVEYEAWRRKTRNMTLGQRLDAVTKAMEAEEFLVSGPLNIEGYFDAISPLIADLYAFEEIESWLLAAGFQDIVRTLDTRNHHVIARKASVPPGKAE